jgi:hypothetical protein
VWHALSAPHSVSIRDYIIYLMKNDISFLDSKHFFFLFEPENRFLFAFSELPSISSIL